MYPNPLIYCTCWDPWNLGPRKLIKTPQPPSKTSTGKPKLTPLPSAAKKQNCVQPTAKPVVAPKGKLHLGKQEESNKPPYEVINVSPGYHLIRNREQISVTLGDEMFDKRKRSQSEIMDRVQISSSPMKWLSAVLRCSRTSKTKTDEMGKEYKYLKNMFHMYQDSIYDEMEDKWLKKKAEWEKDEKLEREKILLQQKHNMTKKFELESEEEKKKINDSYSTVFENFNREKEELLKQHEKDTLQLEELRKTKQVMEEELNAQSVILESLNTSLYQTQMELQREKATVGNLEKTLQTKLAETEEKFKYTIQLLTEENIHLRQKIIVKNEEIYKE
ncbi:flagellum-associated coiled-coil domain-containing protein 1 isoform X2 [Neofelis nebulosa]|uniref:flagellum-associated coiled-coil domain-containing protein 1 isoform X2 n=1 Tax=Neofelis nebulosa TaxID=61452 RepID=UPI00272BE1DA|nr:flagellum-associated coiled-coil domain-containing protein 1 isoform X2 [Neofelis nebulosa]